MEPSLSAQQSALDAAIDESTNRLVRKLTMILVKSMPDFFRLGVLSLSLRVCVYLTVCVYAAENVASGKFSRGASGALSYVSTVGFSPARRGSVDEKDFKAEKDGKRGEKEREKDKEEEKESKDDSDDDEADVARNVSWLCVC